MNYKIINKPILEAINDLEDNSLNAILCSPPYYGLRDYGNAESIWDETVNCHHVFDPITNKCFDCDAWHGQLGLEPTYQMFVKHLVEVFNRLEDKLRDDGCIWVNLGDTYAGGNGLDIPEGVTKEEIKKKWNIGNSVEWTDTKIQAFPNKNPQAKFKKMTKSQIGIPERFKIAMIDSGWICRNTVIWHKPNPMPSSVRDRYTNDFEYFYFFTKKKKYYFKQQFEEVTKKEKTEKKRNKRTLWAEDDKYLDSKYDNPEHEASIRQGMNKERGNNWIKKRNLPPQDKFVTMIREWILHDENSVSLTKSIEELATFTEIPLSTVQHWFRKDEGGFAYPSIEDWEKVEDIYKTNSIGYDFSFLVNYYEETDHINQNEKIIKIRDEAHKNSIVTDIDSKDVPYAIKNRKKSHIIFRELPPLNTIVEYLKEAKSNTTLTINDIEEHFGNSKGHHWFELNTGSYPSVEEWKELKKLLLLDDKYDYAMMTEYAKSSEKRNYTDIENRRNKRTTWRVNVANFKKAHFAVFPRGLIRSPIDACVPEKICLECDKPMDINPCSCDAGFRKGVILDPFCGSGTTIIEAIEQNKMGIGIEVNPDYVEIAKNRIAEETTSIIENDLDWLDWTMEEEGGE